MRIAHLSSLCLLGALASLAQSPVTFQYIYDDLNQLTKVVDSTGVVIEYLYDAAGNIVQIKRLSVAPGALSIFGVSSQTALAGGTITIQGQGFNTNPALDIVTIGGVAVTVLSATSRSLVVSIPVNGVSGPISVSVGTATVTSDFNETVVSAPILTSVTPHAAQAGTMVTMNVTGNNLVGASFSFVPATPQLSLSSTTITADGTGATFSISVAAGLNGRFTVVALRGGASSSTVLTSANAFGAFTDPTGDADNDGLANGYELTLGTDPFNPDTDGDGFSDGVEVATRSDPLNPACTPINCRVSGSVQSVVVSALNLGLPTSGFYEADSGTFSMLNTSLPALQFREADSIVFSVENTATDVKAQTSRAGPPVSSGIDSSDQPAFGSLDSDGDGLTDEEERRLGTNPLNPDTDGDGYPDGLEVALGSDPLDPNSIPDIRPPAILIVPFPDMSNQEILTPLADNAAAAAKGDKNVAQAFRARRRNNTAVARFRSLFH